MRICGTDPSDGRLIVRTNYFSFDGISEELNSIEDRYVYATNVAGPVDVWRGHYFAIFVGEWVLGSLTNIIGRHVTYAYDPLGRKTNEVHLGTNSTALLTNSFSYSAASDLRTLTDGKGQVTTWKYDEYGRVTNKLDATSAEIFRYGYDANSRLTSRWTPAKGSTTYSYDAVGNLTLVNYPASPDLTLQYDALNRVVNMVDAVGTTSYDYTVFGALEHEDGPWDNDTVSYSYTANRLRSGLSLAAPNGSAWIQSYAYDAASRLSTLTSPAGAFGYQYKVGQASSPASLVEKLTLPNGAAITNQFDSQSRWLSTTLRHSGGALLNQHSYLYDDLDRRIQQTRTGGDFVDYGYDDLGQLISASGKETGGSTNRWQEQFGYAYDAAGNLNYRTNHSLLQRFNVDSLNQLTTVTNGGRLTVAGTTTMPATNVTVNTSNALRYADRTFASTNQPWVSGNNTFTAIGQDSLGRVDTNALTVSLLATNTFLYDQNGNLRTNGTRIFQYDDENQLICVTEPGAWMSTNVYDGKLRRRIERNYQWFGSAWVQTNEVRFVYDGNVVLQERNEFNLPVATLTRGLDLSGSLQGAGGIGGLLATTENSALSPLTSYFHSDGNGNVTCLVDTNENGVARYLYDPFGNTLSVSGPRAALNRYRFSSKPIHEPSGMYDFLYRWYLPELQRWANLDPIKDFGFEALQGRNGRYDQQTRNLHAFVGNRPIGIVDPFGLSPWGECWKCLKKSAVAGGLAAACVASAPAAAFVCGAAIESGNYLAAAICLEALSEVVSDICKAAINAMKDLVSSCPGSAPEGWPPPY